METRHVSDDSAMASEAARFASTLLPRRNRAFVVALLGGLGAGKTTFVQGVARFFGITDAVPSPTYVIMKTYDMRETAVGFERLVHVDAYRIEGGEELGERHFDEVLKDPKNLVMIEWPEHVGSLLPEDAVRIEFTLGDGPERFVSYHD